jgi:hypothetical protein
MIDPLQQLYVDVTEIADDLNIDCVQAVELAKRLTNQVQERYRGQRLYIRNFNRQQRNDAMMQAALQGINLDQANRGAALQEQAYLQDRPLNLINSLRTGAQVQNPQFQQFANQATTAGPDMLGAAQAGYGAQMDAYNADQAQSGGMLGGLFGLGASAITGGLF